MIGWEYPPFKAGGLGTHCYGLTRSLADKNVEVDFYMPKTKHSAGSDNKNLVIKEVGETEIFPYDRPEDKALAGKFFEAVYRYNDLVVAKVKGNYNVIHCHDWLTMKAGIVLKEKMGVPLVLTVHSTEYDRSGWLCPNQWFIDIEREGMEKADKIIAVSHFTKRVCIEKYGIHPDKISVVHNAVYPIDEGEKQDVVLFLGRLTIQKGPEFFLHAAKKVLEEAFNNCLRVDFWDTDEMANKIVSLLRYDPLHRTLAEMGKREIDLFTWDRVAEKTIDVYNGVL